MTSSIAWRARISWALLSAGVTLTAWYLTRLVTHVDREATRLVTIEFNEDRPLDIERVRIDLSAFQKDRFRIPRIMIAGYNELYFIVAPATRSIVIEAKALGSVSCVFSERATTGSLAGLIENARRGPFQPATVGNTPRVIVPVPAALHLAVERLAGGQGVIKCTFGQPLVASPTFTDRKIVLQVRNGNRGAVALDLSALEDIESLRFSGGLISPFAGDRTRIFDNQDRVIIAEWSDVSAQERRDVVLVTIGALAAVIAASAIEAIRPFIER